MARSSSTTPSFHCPMVIMTQQAEARGGTNQRLWTNMLQILCQRAKCPKRARNRVTMSIRASAISRQRQETVDSPQTRGKWRTERAPHPGQPAAHLRTCTASAQMQSAPSAAAAMITDENARCNAAMHGAGHAHSEPHYYGGARVPNDTKCRPKPSSATPALQPRCYRQPSPLACNL